MKVRGDYQGTLIASYAGYVVQAIINNLAPLLFLTFQRSFGISIESISLLVTVNFGIQLLADYASAKFADKLGYRRSLLIAHGCCTVGLVCLGLLPRILPNSFVGLLISISIYAIGGGLIEVLLSPIVEACPTKNKSATMSLLHSFYCWGHVFVVLISTVYFALFGIENWYILCMLWAIIPLCNGILFSRVKMPKQTEEGGGMTVRKLASKKIFWVLLIVMMCGGASEQVMCQWASSFAEAGLGVSKAIGDLAGPCLFAVLMGIARAFYARLSQRVSLQQFMIFSGTLCIFSYLLTVFCPLPILALMGCGICGFSVGIMWPGTFSVAAEAFPTGGTAMFGLMALAGDLGCFSGPAVAGLVAGAYDNNLKAGFLVAIIFPLLLVIGLVIYKKYRKKHVFDGKIAE